MMVKKASPSKKLIGFFPLFYNLAETGRAVLIAKEAEKKGYDNDTDLTVDDLKDTYSAILAERALLKTLEGGCQVPIGALAEVRSNGLYLDGMVGSVDGSFTFRKRMRGSKADPEKLGKSLASDLSKAGAKKVLNEIYSQTRNKK